MRQIKEWIKDLRDIYTSIRVKGKPKIFCIGLNKTGTTSLQKFFTDLGYIVGDQKRAERLINEYRNGDFDAIIEYSKTAQVFQDFPFSYPETFKFLDRAFPGSRFILSIRDTPEQWYNSLTGFHIKLFGNGKLPTVHDLKSATYTWKGWVWESFQLFFGVTEHEDDLYEKERIVSAYIKYNQSVIDYFNDQENFLIINLAENGAYGKLCHFLNLDSSQKDFPWENKTERLTTGK